MPDAYHPGKMIVERPCPAERTPAVTAELLDTPYPTVRPIDVPPDLQRVWRCNFCATGFHRSCPGAVRNARPGGKLILCYCCKGSPRCLDCGLAEDIEPTQWACRDSAACMLRVRDRLAGSPLHQQLQECRSDSAERARRIRMAAEGIRAGVPQDEIDEFERPLEKKPRTPRPAVGSCECCGAATRGGRFLPGHDAKMKSRLREAAKKGDVEASAELEQRGW